MFQDLDPAALAVFFGAIAVVVAAYAREREHWGIRRIAFGIATACVGIALLNLAPAVWWWSGPLFGLYQVYLGVSFINRRSRVSAERIDYVTATAKVLAFVALADGELSPKANEVIGDTLTRAGFSPEEVREAHLAAADCERRFRGEGSDPARLVPLLQAACHDVSKHSSHQVRTIFLEAAVRIARSDGFASRGEEQLLRAAASWLGLSQTDVDHAWQSSAAPPLPPVSDSMA
jgi:tellurite resistance protein